MRASRLVRAVVYARVVLTPKFRSRLHQVRWSQRETQETMSRKTGIGLRAYRRLENGELKNPPIRYLVNCARVLRVELEDVCNPEWLAWTEFEAGVKEPPRRGAPTKPR